MCKLQQCGSQDDSSRIPHSANVHGVNRDDNELWSPAVALLPWNTPLSTPSEKIPKHKRWLGTFR